MLWSCKSIDIAQPILNETDPIITGSNVVSQLSIPIEIGMQNQLNEVEKKLPTEDQKTRKMQFSFLTVLQSQPRWGFCLDPDKKSGCLSNPIGLAALGVVRKP